MLVLTRKTNEEIRIGNDITVTVVRMKGDSVRIGINAPPHISIMRTELLNQEPAKRVDQNKSATLTSNETGEEPIVPNRRPTPPTRPMPSPEPAATSPALKQLEDQLNRRQAIELTGSNQDPTSNRFRTPLGGTESFSKVLDRHRTNALPLPQMRRGGQND